MKPGRCHCGKPTKGRLCGECSMYFGLWRQICQKRGWKSSDRAARMQWHIEAGVPAKSHTDFSHGNFSRLKKWTEQELSGHADLDAAIHGLPENEERRNLALSISHKAFEACFWIRGYTNLNDIESLDRETSNLIEAEAEDAVCGIAKDRRSWRLKQDGSDWRELSLENLKQLQYTVEGWRRTKDPTRDTIYVRIQNGPAVDENNRLKGMSTATKQRRSAPLPQVPDDGCPI